MASFGAKYPKFAPIKGDTDATVLEYDEAVTIGGLIKADLTVQFASGELYYDDMLGEKVEEFVSAGIAMETDDMVDDVAHVVYGADVDDGEVTYKAGDDPPPGGLGYYKVLMRNKVKYYKGYFYPLVKAALGNDTAQTKTSSITFGTTQTTFTVFAHAGQDWRITKEFSDEEACGDWVDEKLGKT